MLLHEDLDYGLVAFEADKRVIHGAVVNEVLLGQILLFCLHDWLALSSRLFLVPYP